MGGVSQQCSMERVRQLLRVVLPAFLKGLFYRFSQSGNPIGLSSFFIGPGSLIDC